MEALVAILVAAAAKVLPGVLAAVVREALQLYTQRKDLRDAIDAKALVAIQQRALEAQGWLLAHPLDPADPGYVVRPGGDALTGASLPADDPAAAGPRDGPR